MCDDFFETDFSSKSHREISISYIFLQSPHQVEMKNIVKCYKDFLGYSNTLHTVQYAVPISLIFKLYRDVYFDTKRTAKRQFDPLFN